MSLPTRAMRKSPRLSSPANGERKQTVEGGTPASCMKQEANASSSERRESLLASPTGDALDGQANYGMPGFLAPPGTTPRGKDKLRAKQSQGPSTTKTPDVETEPKEKKSRGNRASRSRGRSESAHMEEKPSRSAVPLASQETNDLTVPSREEKAPESSSVPTLKAEFGPGGFQKDSQVDLILVVDCAYGKAKQNGDEETGLALQLLEEQSRTDVSLHSLMCAILTKTATEAQIADFQNIVKKARKRVARGARAVRPVPAIVADLPPITTENRRSRTKSPAKPSVVKHKEQSQSQRQPSRRDTNSTTTRLTLRTPDRRMRSRSAMPITQEVKDEPPAKRVKLSAPPDEDDDNSSMSSFTSLDSDLEPLRPKAEHLIAQSQDQDVDPVFDKTTGDLIMPNATKSSLASGPKLALLAAEQKATKGLAKDGTVIPTLNLKEEMPAEELAQRRRKLTRTNFDDYKVQASEMRKPLKPKPRPGPIDIGFSFGSRHNRNDEMNGITSPSSSIQGDFIVPPPPEAMRTSRSRADTPTALGRPRKGGAKAARVKVS